MKIPGKSWWVLDDDQVKFLNLMPNIIMLRNIQGEILFWNQKAEELFGWKNSEVIGKSLHTLLHTQFPEPQEAIETKTLDSGQWKGELTHTRRDGAILVTDSYWRIWHHDHNISTTLVEISFDITEKKQIERSLRLLSEAGSALAASIELPDRMTNITRVLVPLLADWCLVHLSQEGKVIKPVAVAHTDPQKLAAAENLLRAKTLAADIPTGAARVLSTGNPVFYQEASEEFITAIAQDVEQIELVRSLGARSAMIIPLITHGHALGTITLVMSNDSGRKYTREDLSLAEELGRRAALSLDNLRLYMESKQLNEELETRVSQRTSDLQTAISELELSKKQLLLLTQHERTRREEDRSRIAREIHDELGQSLTAIKLNLAWLQNQTALKPREMKQKFKDMSDLTDSIIQVVRRIASELRPSILDDLGLMPAMEWQLQEFQKRSGIQCTFNSTLEEVDLVEKDATTLFRILQETLTNVARHAAASQVKVALEADGNFIHMRVQDNGRGITEKESGGFNSFGLLGIRERVAQHSGDFRIRGIPGKGTTIDIKLPMIRK